MPTVEDIARAMADAVGNPDSGVIKDNLDAMAQSVHRLLVPAPVKESRVVKAEETR